MRTSLILIAILGAAGCTCPPAANRDYVEYIAASSPNWEMSEAQRRGLDLATNAELERLDAAEEAADE